MADVFEEEEEEDETKPVMPVGTKPRQDSESGIGVQIVDVDSFERATSPTVTSDDGLGIRGSWEPERPTTSYSNSGYHFFNQALEGRGSSIVEETIMEESSPMEVVEIVEAHEEPRTSSITKSSDSSDTPTIMVPTTATLALPDRAQSLMTPDTYQTSTFSSPDIGGHKNSFDSHSRLGTAASSIADNRTMSSCMTGEHGSGLRVSVDDVPSLSSGRTSTTHANSSRPDFSARDSNVPVIPRNLNPTTVAERRHKRGSIQSLSQLVGNSFGSRSKASDESRPFTSSDPSIPPTAPKKKEHRLKKLMFWKSKQHSRDRAKSVPS